MSKLKIRGYRAKGEENQYSLLDATQEINKIQEWISDLESEKSGLFIHTSFEPMEGSSIRRYTELARNGNIVACATSWALLSPLIADYKWNVVNDSSNYSPKLSSIPSEYFIGSLNNVESVNSIVDASKNPLISLTSITSPYLMELLEYQPELIDVINEFDLEDDETLLDNEFKLPTEARLKLAHIVFDKALKISKPLFDTGTPLKQAEAVIQLALATPEWMMDDGLPNINVRVNNALTSQNINSLRVLSRLSFKELMRMENLGNKSRTELYEFLSNTTLTLAEVKLSTTKDLNIDSCSGSMLSAVNKNISLSDTPSSISNIVQEFCNCLQKVDPKKADYLRLYFLGSTLEEIANNTLTRERIRQIIKKIFTRFAQSFNEILIKAHEFTSFIDILYLEKNATDVLTHRLIELVKFDEKFCMGKSSATTNNILGNIGEIISFTDYEFKLVTLNGIPVCLPFPSKITTVTPDIFIDSIMDIFDIHTREEANQIAKYEFSTRGLPPFLSSLFAIELIENRVTLTQDGMVVKPSPKTDTRRAAILRIFNTSDRPIHWEREGQQRLHDLMPELVGADSRASSLISDIRSKTMSTSDEFIHQLGYGEYALWKHLAINDEQAYKIAEVVCTFLADNPDKQFSDLDLLTHLNYINVTNFDINNRTSKHFITAALFRIRPSNARYLGRFMWQFGTWTDEPDTENRAFMSDILKEAIKVKKRPMTLPELREVVNEERGHGNKFFQIQEKNGIIKVFNSDTTSLYWSTDLDPYPFESIQAQKIQAEITELLTTYSQRSLISLKTSITQNSDLVSEYSDAEFLCLALRTPQVIMDESKDGFILTLDVKHH